MPGAVPSFRTPFLHALLIAALVLSWLSPACQFRSGMLMEICAADGSFKTLYVSGVEDPKAPLDGGHHVAKQPCAFCLAQGSLPGILPAAADLASIDSQYVQAYNFVRFAFFSDLAAGPFARGPPALL